MSKRIKSLFGTDPELEKNGVWIDYGEGTMVKIARAGGANRRYLLRAEALTKPHRRAFDTRTIDPEVAKKINAQVFSETIVLDWKGFEDDVTGEPIPCTPENIQAELLADDDFFEDVQARASQFATFKRAAVEGEIKN